MNARDLERFYTSQAAEASEREWADAHSHLLRHLEEGRIRAAAPAEDGFWLVHPWIKQAILLGFKRTSLASFDGAGYPMFDKSAYPPRVLTTKDAVRMVPGGSAVRRGAHLGKGVVIMPPSYVSVGAFIDEYSTIDSHVLVGSCAQIGKHVMLAPGAQVGGVLDPPGGLPVIIEDDAFLGPLSGVFDGMHVKKRAVLAPGVVLTATSVLYDLVDGNTHQGLVPEGAVVIQGSIPASGPHAATRGITMTVPLIAGYREPGADAANALNRAYGVKK